MGELFEFIWCAIAGLFRSRAALQAEILVLRHQLNLLRRKSPKRVALGKIDRLVFCGLYRLSPTALDALKILQPETVIRWHRAGFRAYWRWRSQRRSGRPRIPADIRHLILEMSVANPLWGAPRIHGELLKLGVNVGQTTVAKYMARRRRPPSQGWKTFLRNHADGIESMDLFVVPTISFRLLYALLVLQHGRRELLWTGVTEHPTAEWIARQLTEAYGWRRSPDYIVRDRDGVYGHAVLSRLRAMGIRDRPIAARSPWQNGCAERLIGSIRRDCLDHVVVFGERHLRHVLTAYQKYYNEARTHLSLEKDAPMPRAVQAVGQTLTLPILGGLHHQYVQREFPTGTTVAKYMARRRRPPSQGWKTFLRNHADGIASMDLFVVPTISFRLLYGLLIMQHSRRQILWLGVTAHPTAEWIARQLSESYGWAAAPRYIVRDRDAVYGDIFIRRLQAMGIRDRPIAARSPWQNGYAERLIGSIRRDCLDYVVVFGERHLRHLLESYQRYYNEARTHLSLSKDAPAPRAVQAVGSKIAEPFLGGLHHQYVRI